MHGSTNGGFSIGVIGPKWSQKPQGLPWPSVFSAEAESNRWLPGTQMMLVCWATRVQRHALKQLWHVNFHFNKSHKGPSFESYFSHWSYHQFAAGIPSSAFSKVRLCSSTDLLEKFLAWHSSRCSKLKKHAAPFPFGRWQAAAWRVSLDPDGNGHISFGPLSWDVHATERLRNLVPFDDEHPNVNHP